MELIKTYREEGEIIFADIRVVDGDNRYELKDIDYISIGKDHVRLYYKKETKGRYSFWVFEYDEGLFDDEGSIVSEIGSGTFTDWDGIRHSHYFDEGYVNYINESLDTVIEMFKVIKSMHEYITDKKTLDGYKYV